MFKVFSRKKSLSSYLGATLSIILIVISATFLYSKIMVIKNVSEVIVMSNYKQGALDYTETFSQAKNGFFVAAALTNYDSSTESVEDPRYGELVFQKYSWGGEDELGTSKTEIKNHSC